MQVQFGFVTCSIYQCFNSTLSLLMSSPSKMFSCVDSNVILKSPINSSTAKTQWSFSKSPRFERLATVYCDRMYDIPTTKSRRTTSMGYDVGKNPHQVVPSPDTYNLKDFTQQNKNHNSGFNISIGREFTQPISYIQLQHIKMPGPGTYNNPRVNTSPKWSLRKRVSTEFFPMTTSTTKKFVPGPGAHQTPIATHPFGRYTLSKFKNSLSSNWNPKSSKRFNRSVSGVPGPGTYQPKINFSNFILSNNKSSGQRIMLQSTRTSFVDEPSKCITSPGPGNYRLPSDFGIYDHVRCHHPKDKMHKSMMLNSDKKITTIN